MTKDKNLLDNVLNCYVCNYFTCNKRDYERHIKTKRHITKIQDIQKNDASPKIERVNATDECDDFTPISTINSTDTQDSVEIMKKTGRKIKRRGTQIPEKTSSGDNVVITHVEFGDTQEDTIKLDIDNDVTNDEPIYETIYTNPLLVRKYIPGVFDTILHIGNIVYKFFIEMMTDTSKPLHQDRF